MVNKYLYNFMSITKQQIKRNCAGRFYKIYVQSIIHT